MPSSRSHSLFTLAGLVCLGVVLMAMFASPANASHAAGSVRIARPAEADFDRHTLAPNPSQQAFMAQRFWRMRTYAPYFDERLAWFPNAWTYRGLYAIYRDDELATQRPDWILRDASGNPLYIPFDCGGDSCTQYAGDIGNPEFRAHWIAEAKRQSARYRGLFIDDVNLEFRVSDGAGTDVIPRDPRTGTAMREADWRRYMAEFTEQIRAAMPNKEIVHNALWFTGTTDAYVRRQIDASTHVELERGVNDPGLTGGGGQFGYETFLEYIDWLHARGKGVILDSYADNRDEMEYELASYFLISTERDSVGSSWQTAPGDWWSGYEVALGAPRGKRYSWRGLLRRDFEGGFVIVNQPDEKPVVVELGADALDPAGVPRSQVRLGGAQGAVVTTGSSVAANAAPTRTVVRPVPNNRRGAVLVRGRVKRATGGGRVRVKLTRRAGKRWVNVRRHTAKVSARGRFKPRFAGLSSGRYRVRAVFLGHRRARPSSAARQFALRR
jgi:Hypothetical glycosyl hydrolase family 15